MAKKNSTKVKYVSKGQRRSVSAATRNARRRDYLASADRLLAQQAAFYRGKNVVLTIENPNKHDTARRFIRVNGADFFLPRNKDKHPNMFSM